MRRSDGFGRVLAWAVVLLAALVAMAAPARAYDGDWVIIDTGEGVPSESTPEDSEPSGYWELIEVYDTESDNYADEPHEGYLLEGSASGGFHAKYTITQDGYRFSYTNLDERAHNGTSCKGEYGETRTTFSPLPKSRLVAGDELAMTATVACATSAHKVGLNSQVTVRFMPEPTSGSYIYFKNASDGYVVAPDSEWVTEGERSGGYSCYDVDTSDVYSALVPDGAASWGDELYIRFDCTVSSYTISTFFHYGWEEGKPASEGVEVTGEVGRNGTPDQTTNPEGRQDLVIDTDASHDPGAFSKVLIPAAIVVGAGVAVGAYVSKKRKGNKSPSNKSTPNKKDEQKQQSSYIMVLEKDFGNELRAGGKPREVKARIEERMPEFETNRWIVRKRADLTQRIASYGVQNIEVISTRFQPPNMVATLRVPASAAKLKGDARKATVAFRYTGAGGTLTNNVTFKLAPEPALVYVKEPEGTVPALWEPSIEAIMPDEQGITFYIGAQNFDERPNLPQYWTDDGSIRVDFEPYDDARLPDLFVFKVRVKNGLKATSLYGQWPLDRKLCISAENNYGERAEMELRLRFWPEGISFDTSRLKPGNARKDSVLVDTGDILESKTVEYNIEGATMEVAVAYKDEQDHVVVTRPEEPHDGAYLRLVGTDDASEKVLNPNEGSSNSHVWYTLTYLHKPSYSGDGRLGTLVLTPLMPMVTEHVGTEFSGSYELSFVRDSFRCDAKATFDIKGVSAEDYENDREKLIGEIYKMLAAFRLDDWTRVDNVLASFGAEAERERARLGTPEQRERAAQSGTRLVSSIKDIQSVQRLNAIRKMVYEAANVTLAHDSVEANSEADLFDTLYNTACCVRWANDIAFNCWWYAVLKDKKKGDLAIYFMTPLKKYVEGYLEVLGLHMFDSDVDASLGNYFTLQCAHEKLFVPYVEGYISDLVEDAIKGKGLALIKDPKTYAALGGIGAFLFLKHAPSHWKTDEATGYAEFDLWATLKDTMDDFTMSSIKTMLSLILAKKLKRLNSGEAKGIVFSRLDSGLTSAFKWFLNSTFDSSTIGVALTAEDQQSMIWGKLLGCEYLENRINENAVKPVTGSVQNAVRDYGTVTLHAVAADGSEYSVEVSLLTAMLIFVNRLFAQCGLDFSLNVSTTLPDNPDYRAHDALVKDLKKIEASKEVDFLRNTTWTQEWSTPKPENFVSGAMPPTMNTGIDPRLYAY